MNREGLPLFRCRNYAAFRQQFIRIGDFYTPRRVLRAFVAMKNDPMAML